MEDDGIVEGQLSRRKALQRIGTTAAIAWSAPVLSSLNTPALAGTPEPGDPIIPRPECVGSSCQNFVNCSSSNTFCVCGTIAPEEGGGGFCIDGRTPCSTLGDPPCGPDEILLIDSCCNRPVCVPISLQDACPPDAQGLAGITRAAPASTGAPTIGGF